MGNDNRDRAMYEYPREIKLLNTRIERLEEWVAYLTVGWARERRMRLAAVRAARLHATRRT